MNDIIFVILWWFCIFIFMVKVTHVFKLADAVGDAADGAESAEGEHPHLGPVGRVTRVPRP